MALETEDDYQDKIDDLNKEIEKLYDEGTDKGFKLKREEDMEQEARAMETQDDYQKAYDKLNAKMQKENDDWSKKSLDILNKIEALQSELKRIEKQSDAVYDKDWHELKDIWDEAKKKGFKLKGVFRSASYDAELRALKTEKDYQNQIDYFKKSLSSKERLIKVWLGDCKEYEQKIAKLDAEKKEVEENLKITKSNIKFEQQWKDENSEKLEKVYKEGLDKGFKLKRGEDMDFETRKNSIIADITDLEARKNEVLQGLEQRALETEKDYQKEIGYWKNENEIELIYINKLKKEIKDRENEIKLNNKEIEKLYKEGTAKGFKLKK